MTAVDITYRGLKVATGARLVPSEAGGFVEVETPLPVGTIVALSGVDVQKPARVVGVVEQEAGQKTVAGMRLLWDEPAHAPAPPPPLVEAPPVEAAPLVEAPLVEAPPVAAAPPVEAPPVEAPPPAAAALSPEDVTTTQPMSTLPEPDEPDAGDSASMTAPPLPGSGGDEATPGNGEPKRRRRRRNASRT